MDEKAGHQQTIRARHPDPSRWWPVGTISLAPGGLPEATPTRRRAELPDAGRIPYRLRHADSAIPIARYPSQTAYCMIQSTKYRLPIALFCHNRAGRRIVA